MSWYIIGGIIIVFWVVGVVMKMKTSKKKDSSDIYPHF